MSGATKLMTAGGGGVSLTPASSIASDVTVNVPSQNCTLGIQGPAFSATINSTTTATSSTYTKLVYGQSEFDTNSNYSTANSTFTPTVAGYYIINANAGSSGGASGQQLLTVYKNGSAYYYGGICPINSQFDEMNVSCLVYLNGSTDYVEIYWWQNLGSSQNIATQNAHFQGVLARAA